MRPAGSPASQAPEAAAPAPATTDDDRLDATAVPLIEDVLLPAVRALERDDGWAALSSVGAYIVNNQPSFDSRNYGSPRLGQLVRSLNFVGVKQVASTDGSEHPYVRLRPATPRRP